MAEARRPKVILSLEARRDIRLALKWSRATFGEKAAIKYEALIEQALRDIEADPERLGSRERLELGEGVRTLHLSLSRDRARTMFGIVHKPRHFVVYRRRSTTIVDVVRILHDASDLALHLPESDGDNGTSEHG